MANPLHELRALLGARQTSTTGKVVSLTSGGAMVSVGGRIREANRAVATALRVGDTVRVAGGSIVAVVTPDDELPTFVV